MINVPEGHGNGGLPQEAVIHLPDHVVPVEHLVVGVPRHVVALEVGEVPLFSSQSV